MRVNVGLVRINLPLQAQGPAAGPAEYRRAAARELAGLSSFGQLSPANVDGPWWTYGPQESNSDDEQSKTERNVGESAGVKTGKG